MVSYGSLGSLFYVELLPRVPTLILFEPWLSSERYDTSSSNQSHHFAPPDSVTISPFELRFSVSALLVISTPGVGVGGVRSGRKCCEQNPVLIERRTDNRTTSCMEPDARYDVTIYAIQYYATRHKALYNIFT